MSRVTVLGGSGAVGSVAAETLASSGFFSEIVLADARLEQAKKLAAIAASTPRAKTSR